MIKQLSAPVKIIRAPSFPLHDPRSLRGDDEEESRDDIQIKLSPRPFVPSVGNQNEKRGMDNLMMPRPVLDAAGSSEATVTSVSSSDS